MEQTTAKKRKPAVPGIRIAKPIDD
jgi:hypothetical protein